MKHRFATVLALALIAAATLVPTTSGGGTTGVCILCGERGLADFLLNIGLFTPLGASLASVGLGLVVSTGAGGLLSLGIELAQLSVISGRDSNIGDLLANSAGTGAGWLLFRGLVAAHLPHTRIPDALPSLLAGFAATLLIVGLWLMTPHFPDRPYYLQWTADLEHLERYDGTVLSSGIGGLDLPGPPGRIARSDSVRRLLRGGAPLRVAIMVGSTPARLAPILGIYDDRRREVSMIGAQGTDLVYRYRLLGQAARLDGGDIRFARALAGMAASTITTITVVPGAGEYCAMVGERRQCRSGYSAGETSMLLYYQRDWGAPLRTAVTIGWLMILFLPAGLIGRAWPHRTLAVAVAVVALALAPPALGFAATPVGEIVAAALGVVAGGMIAALVTWPKTL